MAMIIFLLEVISVDEWFCLYVGVEFYVNVFMFIIVFGGDKNNIVCRVIIV